MWKHDLFDVFDQSPSPPAEDEGSVKYRSVVQKVPSSEEKWVHDKFEAESGNDRRERRDGRGADNEKWVHDKFEAESGNDRRERRDGRGADKWVHDKFEESRNNRRERRDQEDRRRDQGDRRRDQGDRRRRDRETKDKSPHRSETEVSDRWGKKENKTPPREEKSVPMDTSTVEA